MGFLIPFIFLALAFCFLMGLLLGLLWWWVRRRGESAEYQRRLLAADAEADRLRLRVSSLKSAEARGETLGAELEANRKELARVPELERDLAGYRTRAALVPGLEEQVASLQTDAHKVPSLETRISALAKEVARVPGLEAEILRLQADAERASSLDAELVTLQGVAGRVPDLESRISGLEAEAATVGARERDLETRIQSLTADLEAAGADAERVGELEAQLAQARSEAPNTDEFETRIASLREELSQTRSRVSDYESMEQDFGSLRGDLESLRSLLLERDATIEGLRGDLATVNAEAGRVSGLEAELESVRNQTARIGAHESELEAELARVNAELNETRDRATRVEARERDKEAELERLQGDAGRVSGLEADVLGFRARLDDVTPRAERADRLQADLDRTAGDLASAQTELAELRGREARITELEAELAELRNQSARITRLEAELAAARAEAERVAPLEAELTAVRSDGDVRRAEATIGNPRADLEKTPKAEKSSGKPTWQQGTTTLGTPGADHVDDLKRIHGIGPVMERTLQSFGIRTWEQVAAFTPADIEKVTAAIAAFPGRIERDDWMGGAQALLDAGHVPGDSKPKEDMPAKNPPANEREKKADKPSWQQGTTTLGTPGAAHTDDLKVINGIGPVMEKTLQSLGIRTWEQLAALQKTDVDKVTAAIDAFPGRIERDEWVRQATDLVTRFPLRSPYDRPTRKTFLNESNAN